MKPIARVGQGYDLHRRQPGRKLILAGIEIPNQDGLLGHSDADVVIHAVIDALLGAAGLGDIGEHFPDTDPKYKDIDSSDLLKKTRTLIESLGYQTANIDATIIAEKPKLTDYKPDMRRHLAQLLDLPPQAVSIKAKTNEGLGDTGQGRAIACLAIASLTRRND